MLSLSCSTCAKLSFGCYEIIIVDDNSSDGLVEIIRNV
ncbi:MAG: glycosyltransferase [Thermodesulfobacteriota bacterium]